MFQIEKDIECPYCGEPLSILIDPSEPEQDYVEDCQVCCRPIRMQVEVISDDDAVVYVSHENDT